MLLKKHWMASGCSIGLLLLAVGVPSVAAPDLQFTRKDKVTLEFKPMTARALGDGPTARSVVVEDAGEGRLEMDLAWPGPDDRSRLVLVATRRLAADGVTTHVSIAANLTTSDGETVSATRKMAFTETATALFEVARSRDRMLTFAVAAEASHEQVLAPRPTYGRPVRFELEIQWVEGERTTTLETNQMDTFVGQPVSYSFRLGEAGEAESVNLQLLPGELLDDVVRIDVEISANLPDPEQGATLMSRREQWLATRGATSSLSLESGEPPRGFRFLVTPFF